MTTAGSRHVVYGVCAAAALLLAAAPAQAQWASKPPPPLPRPILDQGLSGSVVLRLVFANDGRVTDAQIARTSGNPGLDSIAREGAMRWRLSPAALQPSDTTVGRRHLIKFHQNGRVARRVEPFKAFWKEL